MLRPMLQWNVYIIPNRHMETENLVETIKRELPALVREDPSLRRYILELTRKLYAPREQTEDRIERILDELRRDREEQARKWDASQAEQKHKWEEQNRKWEEQNRKWEEQNRKWDATQAEQKLKWEASREEFRQVHEEIMEQAKKFDRSIGGLGARWGLQSEAAFRNALAGVLEESFGVKVLNVNEYDDEGEVFGRPDQVELDILVTNGMLLICELKSSIDKAGMYAFDRKVSFYEKRHQRQAERKIVISPMIDPRAMKVAEELGIETYSDSLDVKTEPLESP